MIAAGLTAYDGGKSQEDTIDPSYGELKLIAK